MAAGVLVTVPPVIAALVCQRRIIAGLTAGGVKQGAVIRWRTPDQGP
ncbi:hypothetical protein OH779_39620 [Actinacidiphila glaucinigra]